MLSLMNRALQPSSLYQDKVLYLASEGFYHSICSDVSVVVDKIKDLLTSSNQQFQGLSVLEIALNQNSEIYLKGQWSVILIGLLKDNNSGAVLKQQACKILGMLVAFYSKDPGSPLVDSTKIVQDLCPVLLNCIYENDVWIDAAAKCLQICVHHFPMVFESNVDLLLKVILRRASYSISSNSFEALAECFSEIPNCYRCRNEEILRAVWGKHFLCTLNTLLKILTSLLSYIKEDPDIRYAEDDVFAIEEEVEESEPDVFTSHFRTVCQFINLSKCLAKLLTKKTHCHVNTPVQHTLQLVTELFSLPEKIKPTTLEVQLTLTTLAQLQTAALDVLEALMLNFNLRNLSSAVSSVLNSAMKPPKLSYSGESASELRIKTWKILNLWLTTQGILVSSSIVLDLPNTVEELFKDINPEDEEKKETSQSNSTQGQQKSKKMAAKPPKTKSYLVKKNSRLLCTEALKVLRSLVYSKEAVDRNIFKQIYEKTIQILVDIQQGCDLPCPYDDELCRKNLYSVLLALISIARSSDQCVDVLTASLLFRRAKVDPSHKVTRLYHRAAAIGKINVPPTGPLSKGTKERQKTYNVSREVIRMTEDNSPFIDNPPPIESETVPEISENSSRIGHNANENEMHAEEYMEMEAQYSEQIPESQCNGEEALDVQSSSQGHEIESEDEEEEDDDDEEEEVEEEEERSYGEEEMNQDESMFLPTKLQILNPVHINQETVETRVEPEYESLRPCARTETNAVDNSKNIHLNGVRSIVPAEDAIASSSNQPTLANENGIYEEEIDNEDEGNIDEEEEITFPAEKKVTEHYDPPAKRQRIETNEVEEDHQNDENERDSRSPTLAEMKADFICNEVEDVKS